MLTGSTRYSSLPTAAQSLTGRLHIVTLRPLSKGEFDGIEERFVEQLLTDPAALVTPAASSISRQEYVERLLRGGLPLAVSRRSGLSRNRWFDDYLNLVIQRNVAELSTIRRREKMPRLLARLAARRRRGRAPRLSPSPLTRPVHRSKKGQGNGPLGWALYLPEERCEDAERRRKAKGANPQ